MGRAHLPAVPTTDSLSVAVGRGKWVLGGLSPLFVISTHVARTFATCDLDNAETVAKQVREQMNNLQGLIGQLPDPNICAITRQDEKLNDMLRL